MCDPPSGSGISVESDCSTSALKRVTPLWSVLRLFAGCLIVPLACQYAIWTAAPALGVGWIVLVLITHSAIALLFIAAPWDRISHWLRYLAPAGLIGACYHSHNLPGAILSLFALAALFGILRWKALGAVGGALRIAFPLHGGLYCVSSGGSSPIINHHLARPSQEYAIDIVRLNWLGKRSQGFYPRDYRRHTVYGALVCAPCNGTVSEAVDGLPDGWSPRPRPAWHSGNCIIIHCQESNVYVGLAHLQRGTLKVRKGQEVYAGQPLGLVGNSGNITEPHLHIHAKRGGKSDSMADGQAVPLAFDGTVLIRNDIFRASETPKVVNTWEPGEG